MDYNRRPGIDLHIHSTASDGTLSPQAILKRASQLKIRAIAITDHDTVDGCREALALKKSTPPEFLTGVEISASRPSACPGSGSFHILGYGIDVENRQLNRTLAKLQTARKDRNPQIIDRLRQLGFDLSLDQLVEKAGDKTQIGRPHIAALLVEKGFVASINEAFDRFLGTGKPAYVDKYRVGCDAAIGLILEAGGVPVIAHPGLLDLPSWETAGQLVEELKTMGLQGIEVFYPEHSEEETRKFAALAEKNGLIVTGGTDFHGAIKPEIEMGTGAGNFHVPHSVYETVSALLRKTKNGVTDKNPFREKTNRTADMTESEFSELENKIQHKFKNPTILLEALQHSSYVNEQPDEDMRDNERLEFLGDAVLNLVVGHALMERFPKLTEGDLSRTRANLVNESTLAALGRKLKIGGYVRLGRGEAQTNGHKKPSILADTMEAVIAAVYLDGGFSAAFDLVYRLYRNKFEADHAPRGTQDYKSRLQETVQGDLGLTPSYAVINESGPDHDKTFHVKMVAGDIIAEGRGKSKKAAEQSAAKYALDAIAAEKELDNDG